MNQRRTTQAQHEASPEPRARVWSLLLVMAIGLQACGGGGDPATDVGGDGGATGGATDGAPAPAPGPANPAQPPDSAMPAPTTPGAPPAGQPAPQPVAPEPTAPGPAAPGPTSPPGSGPGSPGPGYGPPGAGSGENGLLQIAILPAACLAVGATAMGQVLALTSPAVGPAPVTDPVQVESDNSSVVAVSGDTSANFQIVATGAGVSLITARVSGDQSSAVVGVRAADAGLPLIVKSGCLVAVHATQQDCGTIRSRPSDSFVQRINVAGHVVGVFNCSITDNPSGLPVVEY